LSVHEIMYIVIIKTNIFQTKLRILKYLNYGKFNSFGFSCKAEQSLFRFGGICYATFKTIDRLQHVS